MKILGIFPIKFFSPSNTVITDVLPFGKLRRCHQIPKKLAGRTMLELNMVPVKICIPSLNIPEKEGENLGLSLCIEERILCVKVVYVEPTSFLNAKIVVKSSHHSQKSTKQKKRSTKHTLFSSTQKTITKIRPGIEVENVRTKNHSNSMKGFHLGGYASSWKSVLSHHGSGWECHGGGPDLGKHH